MRPTCGPLSEAAKRFAAMRGFEQDPPRGVPALRDLLCAIRQHSALDATTDGDDRFIEGAGAFLGLVLAERFGSGRHVSHGDRHGLQLGEHGYFDPFACVARTLDAEQQADTLLSGVAEAEAEAHDRSHCARVLQCLVRTLAERGSSLRVVRRIDHRVWLEGNGNALEVDLSRLLAVTAGESAQLVDEAVGRFASALCGGPEAAASAEPWSVSQRRLLPRVVGRAFKERLSSGGCAPALVERALIDELQIALVLQYEGRARYVLKSDLPSWDVSAEVAEQMALANLGRRAARIVGVDGPSPMLRVRSSDGNDAARLLLPAIQQRLIAGLGGPVVLAVPHRDALLACQAQDGLACQRLAARAYAEAARAPHAVSGGLWLLTAPGHLQPFPL